VGGWWVPGRVRISCGPSIEDLDPICQNEADEKPLPVGRVECSHGLELYASRI